MNGRSMRTIALVFALSFLATTAALAADAPLSTDKAEDDKQRIAQLEQRIARLEQRIEDLQRQIDELQASQAQQNELLNAHSAEIHALKEGRTEDDLDHHQVEGQTGNDLGRQVKALKERLDALERPVR